MSDDAKQVRSRRVTGGYLNVRAPRPLVRAVHQTAAQRAMSVSAFVRHALVRQLEADGWRRRATDDGDGPPRSHNHLKDTQIR